MKTLPLSAYPRTAARRGAVKQLRASGRVPAVIYGRHTTPQNVEIKSKEIEDLLHRAASEILLLDLAIDGDARPKRLALVQEIQHHPLNGKILHVDFHEVNETEKVVVLVPVEAVGESEGVKTGGGTLEHVLFKLRVRSLPKDLPEVIEVDVTHLQIGQSIHIGEIKPPAGVEILGDKHLSVLAVAAPLTEEQEAALVAEAGTAVGEVEMIKEKKEEGEGEPGAEAKPGEKAAVKPGEKAPAAKPGEKVPAAKPGEKVAAAKPGEKAPAAKSGEKPAAAPAAGKK